MFIAGLVSRDTVEIFSIFKWANETYCMEQSLSENLNGFQLDKKFPHSMESAGSLPHSQLPATCPYPEPDQSVHRSHSTYWRPILILSSHLRLGLPSGLFPSDFSTNILCTPLLCPIRATCPVQLFFSIWSTE